MDLKAAIYSILKDGEKSPHLKFFVEICVSAAISCLNNSRYKKDVLMNMNHSMEDIAVDLIGDLFKTEDRKFVYFLNHFSDVDILNTEHDILKAKLVSLVYNRSSQRISKIRMEFGEKFFNIEKAVNEEIKRHPDIYKQITFNGKILIFTCNENEIDTDKPVCREDLLLDYLFGKKYKTAEIPEIMKYIYEFLNLQDEFINAYDKTELASLITKFHKRRRDGINNNFMGY